MAWKKETFEAMQPCGPTIYSVCAWPPYGVGHRSSYTKLGTSRGPCGLPVLKLVRQFRHSTCAFRSFELSSHWTILEFSGQFFGLKPNNACLLDKMTFGLQKPNPSAHFEQIQAGRGHGISTSDTLSRPCGSTLLDEHCREYSWLMVPLQSTG